MRPSILGTAVAAVSVAACTVTGCAKSPEPKTAPPTASSSPTTAAPTTSPSPTSTPLYELLGDANAVGKTGGLVEATLRGKTYPGATGVWVGCEGTAATATYPLKGRYAALTGELGLMDHTPPQVSAKVTILVDGSPTFSQVLRRDQAPVHLNVPVTDAQSITVTALAVSGDCGAADLPYGAIVDAELR